MKNVAEKCTGGTWDLTYDAVTQTWEISREGIFGPFALITRREGQSTMEVEANARCMANAGSMASALWAIVNMQVIPESDKGEILALCMSIAQIELRKDGKKGRIEK